LSTQKENFTMTLDLMLILVSGKTKEFPFSPNDSATDIAKHVYDNWPMDWEEEQVSSPNILRLIYQGRFLHGNVTLGGKLDTFFNCANIIQALGCAVNSECCLKHLVQEKETGLAHD
uniref:Ubiquitin like 3 n=1 Tax=Astyanax mexicanus TaxID=7994 RepID=A0A3B1JW82_ASTMX